MHTHTIGTMHETMHAPDGWVRMEDYAKLHDERCHLEDAINVMLEAEGFDGHDQDAYWTRRNEIMAAGQAWRARMEIIPEKAKLHDVVRKMTVSELEALAKTLGVEPSELLEGTARTTAPVLGVADCTW